VLLLLNWNLYKWRTTKWVWCVDFHRAGDIYRGDWDLHRLGEVGIALGGGWAAKPCGWPVGWGGLHRLGLLLLM
jgi:hypothetical protein